jgi:hypothetical protein
MPSKHDSEKLFDECVRRCGGVRVTTIVGRVPPFENADYCFEVEGVVAELKSLQKDFLTAAETEQKMHLLFNKWVNEGRVAPAYGCFMIKTNELPEDCAEDFLMFSGFRWNASYVKLNGKSYPQKKGSNVRTRLDCYAWQMMGTSLWIRKRLFIY